MELVIKLIIVAGIALSSVGCVHVKPWQMGDLTRSDMKWEPDPRISSTRDHIYMSKEGSSNNSATAKAGCACH